MGLKDSNGNKKKFGIGIVYRDIDKGGGYPRDVLKIYSKLLDMNIAVYKVKTFLEFLRKKNNLNIVHIFVLFLPVSILIALYCNIFKIPYIVSTFSHLTPFAMKKKQYKKYLFFVLFGRYILNHAKVIHAFTEYEKNTLIDLGVTSKIKIISLGIYPEDVGCLDLQNSKKIIELDKPYILFFGRLDIYQKGIDILIDGFQKYIQKSKKYSLIICGRNWKDGDFFIKDTLARHDCSNRISYLGEVDEFNRDILIENADAFIYPSRFDGPPRPVRLAIARKQKVLVSYQSNMIDSLEKNGWGLKFEANANAIFECIFTFENMNDWPKYKNPAKVLSWDVLMSEYLAMYKNINV